jgi:hypothetical protein
MIPVAIQNNDIYHTQDNIHIELNLRRPAILLCIGLIVAAAPDKEDGKKKNN